MTASDMVGCHINLDDESFLERPVMTLFADLYHDDFPSPARGTAGRKRWWDWASDVTLITSDESRKHDH